MKSLTSLKIRYTKSQRIGISALVILIVLLELGIGWIKNKKNPILHTEVPEEIFALQAEIDASESIKVFSPFKSSLEEIKEFNPNQLNETDWQKLGFSPKQTAVILKYKNLLGGKFSSKQELKECYVISEDKFKSLEPFILLPEFSNKPIQTNQFNSKYQKEKLRINYKKFNPNNYSQQEWISIGFSEKQAAAILKYKNSLGGKFTSLEQIQKCFVISEEKFAEMKPYMILDLVQDSTIPTTQTVQQTKVFEKFNPNDLTREQWMDLGFTEKQVNTLFNYKQSLGGKFKDAATLKKCYSISEAKFAEIEGYLVFD